MKDFSLMNIFSKLRINIFQILRFRVLLFDPKDRMTESRDYHMNVEICI